MLWGEPCLLRLFHISPAYFWSDKHPLLWVNFTHKALQKRLKKKQPQNVNAVCKALWVSECIDVSGRNPLHPYLPLEEPSKKQKIEKEIHKLNLLDWIKL